MLSSVPEGNLMSIKHPTSSCVIAAVGAWVWFSDCVSVMGEHTETETEREAVELNNIISFVDMVHKNLCGIWCPRYWNVCEGFWKKMYARAVKKEEKKACDRNYAVTALAFGVVFSASVDEWCKLRF